MIIVNDISKIPWLEKYKKINFVKLKLVVSKSEIWIKLNKVYSYFIDVQFIKLSTFNILYIYSVEFFYFKKIYIWRLNVLLKHMSILQYFKISMTLKNKQIHISSWCHFSTNYLIKRLSALKKNMSNIFNYCSIQQKNC